MASSRKEHRMVFDIRGRRRYAVKVVYAILALLMGVSLFLVVGPVNIGEIFSNESGSANLAAQFESEAEELEVRIRKQPENPNLYVGLMRARVNAARSLYKIGEEERQEPTPQAVQQLQLASEAWSNYLKATDEPTVGVAQSMAPQLMTLASYGGALAEVKANVAAAVAAQKIVAEARPSLGSLSNYAFYSAINGEYAQARKIAKEAQKYANSKLERENLQTELKRYEEVGHEFRKNAKEVEKREAAAGGGKQKLESPLGGGL